MKSSNTLARVMGRKPSDAGSTTNATNTADNAKTGNHGSIVAAEYARKLDLVRKALDDTGGEQQSLESLLDNVTSANKALADHVDTQTAEFAEADEHARESYDQLLRIVRTWTQKLVAALDIRYEKVKSAGLGDIDFDSARNDWLTERRSFSTATDVFEAITAFLAAKQKIEKLEEIAPTPQKRRETSESCAKYLEKMTDDVLQKKQLLEKASYALRLCANGPPAKPSAYKQLTRLYEGVSLDPGFQSERDQQCKDAGRQIADIPELRDYFDAQGKPDAAKWQAMMTRELQHKHDSGPDDTQPDATATADTETQASADLPAVLTKVHATQAAVLKMPPIPVIVRENPYDTTKAGGYGADTNDIVINPCFLPGTLKDFVSTVIHETFHAHQEYLVRQYQSDPESDDGADRATVLMFLANSQGIGYLKYDKSRPPPTLQEYLQQPTEQDAEQNGQATWDEVLRLFAGRGASELKPEEPTTTSKIESKPEPVAMTIAGQEPKFASLDLHDNSLGTAMKLTIGGVAIHYEVGEDEVDNVKLKADSVVLVLRDPKLQDGKVWIKCSLDSLTEGDLANLIKYKDPVVTTGFFYSIVTVDDLSSVT